MHLTEQLQCHNVNGCTTKHNERQFKIMQVLHGKQIVLHLCFFNYEAFYNLTICTQQDCWSKK